MVVKKNIHKTNVKAPHLPEGNFLAGRIGFWALVKEVNSINNTVTVISDTGFIFKNIPVKSDEWVTINDSKDYIPSQRNLPPINSRVFVLTPTYSATGAFVLCSGFSRGDENIRKLWASGESELEDKNNCRETKTQGGWDITEEYANGNFKAASNDGKIVFTANTTEDSDKSQVKEVSLKAWGRELTINENGISVVDIEDEDNNKKNEIIFSNGGITVTDVNNNTIETSDSGITVTDTYNKEIELSHSSTAESITVKDGSTEIIKYNHPQIGETTITFLGHLEVSG